MAITPEFIADEVARGKHYFLVLLMRGPRERNDSDLLKDMQQQHLQHMFALRQDGKLLLNGPTLIDSKLRGICIFNGDSEDEVQSYVRADPMVAAGFLSPKIYPWMGLPGDVLL